MSNVVISVENLSKEYRLGQIGTGTLSRDINVWWAKVRGNANPMLRLGETDHGNRAGESLWALKDVSFTVEQGEALGIIGRNGAGKSTLLKILSRVTAPTSGRVKVKGRIASLLEVGTGFHPDLTGRENTYLNGAILGMTRREVHRKLDEIVAFAEIERFIDTPVKRYSSGMYVRLAFAVAAHLDPEILVVDEVLAVGDVEFQKKCLGKMGDVTHEGRTVLFVSHNMNAISSLCSSGLLFELGKLTQSGTILKVVQDYLQSAANKLDRGKVKLEIPLDAPFFIKTISICNDQGNIISSISKNDRIVIKIEGNSNIVSERNMVAIDIKNNEDNLLFRTHSIEQFRFSKDVNKLGNFTLNCIIPANLLPAGTYRVGIISALTGIRELQNLQSALEFDVYQDQLLGNQFIGSRGILTPQCEWSLEKNAN